MSTLENIYQIDLAITQQLTSELAWHYRLVPFQSDEASISFYTDDVNCDLDELKFMFDRDVVLEYLDPEMMQQLLVKFYRINNSTDNGNRVFAVDDEKFLDALNSRST